jgi:hypothetical protein
MAIGAIVRTDIAISLNLPRPSVTPPASGRVIAELYSKLELDFGKGGMLIN